MKTEIKETWRGWQGHFICHCWFHLNTLLTYGKTKIIVSTVGQYYSSIEGNKLSYIGIDRKYETMVFYSSNDKYDDIDATKELCQFFKGYNEELKAQKGHYIILDKVKKYLIGGVNEN